MFKRVSISKNNYNKILFFDKHGNELSRVPNESKRYESIEERDVVSQANKEAFEKAVNSDNSDYYYVSNLELSTIKGQLEYPKKPIIKISTPIYDGNNEIQGVLIVDFLSENIINIFTQQVEDNDYDFINHYLVNSNGYYLYSHEREKMFSFMFETEEQHSFEQKWPNVFKEVLDNDRAHFEKDGIIYLLKAITLSSSILQTEFENQFLYYITEFNIESLPQLSNLVLFYLSGFEIIIILALSILILYIIVVVYYRNIDRSKLSLACKIASNTNDAILITDSNKKIIYANKAYEIISGYSEDEIIGQRIGLYKSGLHDDDFYGKMWEAIKKNGYWSGEVWDKKKGGLYFPKKLSIHAVNTIYGNKVDKYVGIYSDLSTLDDSETHIPSFNSFASQKNASKGSLLQKLVEYSIEKNGDKPFGLFCFTITKIDEVSFDQNNLKTQDKIYEFIENVYTIIAKDDFITQVSKTTFAVGLLSLGTKDKIEMFCNQFFEINKNLIKKDHFSFFLNIKAGVAIYPSDNATTQGLLASAGTALEVAKSIKSNNFVFYSQQLKDMMSNQAKIQMLLMNSIQKNELSINYQPQVNNITGKVESAEALLRWNNKELGSISPYFFIPIAEKSGFIIELGYWVIDRVFRDFKKLEPILPQDFRISINVSPIQFKDKNLVQKLNDLSKKHNVDLKRFELEITESVLVSDINIVNINLEKFKELGVTIAIDDFGTGFSSLNYLRTLNFDKIKIDRSFIKDYPHLDNGGLIKIMVDIAKEFSLSIIAEGVETKEQNDYLKTLGCNFIQGYYYSKPLKFKDFKDFYLKHS